MIATVALVWAAFAVQRPAQPEDSAARARFVAAVRAVDDSLNTVRGAAREFRLDLVAASPELVRVRATRVQARCLGARAVVVQLAELLATQVYTPQSRAAQEALRQELPPLMHALTRCLREWNSGSNVPVDSLKAWGPYRGAQLVAAVDRYGAKAAAFRSAVGLR